MLELLLFYAIPRRDTNKLAHRLIRRYGSISGVFDADADELIHGAGLSENTAALIKLIPALAREYLLDRSSRTTALDSFEKIGAYLCDYFTGLSRELAVVLPISAGGMPSSPEIVGEGSPDGCDIDMRKLAECVIRANASSFILAHNHPGTNAEPSDADLAITKLVRDTFARLGISIQHLGSSWLSKRHLCPPGNTAARAFYRRRPHLYPLLFISGRLLTDLHK
ncbi:MAG: JAB domain-containing protein [Eubacteriales bacterium]|jgi:DNA repair protein RadC